MKVISYFKCKCGATTFITNTGDYFSCQIKLADNDLKGIVEYPTTLLCNHCRNQHINATMISK